MNPMLNLWLIPILPLAGAAINGFLGKKSSRSAVTTVALFFSGAAFAMALWVAMLFSSLTLPYHEYLMHWIRSGNFSVDFAFYLDQLSLVMLLVVTGVGFLIHIYSVGYMGEDPGYYRFFSYLNLFMFFMLTLVLAEQLPDDVYRVGGRGPGVVSADRVLVHEGFGGVGGQESVYRKSNRRLRISDRTVFADQAFWIAEF